MTWEIMIFPCQKYTIETIHYYSFINFWEGFREELQEFPSE